MKNFIGTFLGSCVFLYIAFSVYESLLYRHFFAALAVLGLILATIICALFSLFKEQEAQTKELEARIALLEKATQQVA